MVGQEHNLFNNVVNFPTGWQIRKRTFTRLGRLAFTEDVIVVIFCLLDFLAIYNADNLISPQPSGFCVEIASCTFDQTKGNGSEVKPILKRTIIQMLSVRFPLGRRTYSLHG